MTTDLIQPMSRIKAGQRAVAVLFDGRKREASSTYVIGRGFNGVFLYDAKTRRMIAPELIKGWQPIAPPADSRGAE